MVITYIFIGCTEVDFEKSYNSEILKKSMYANFEPLWELYLESANGGWKDNDNGRFSNDDAPVIQALLELYEITKDSRYIDKLYSLVNNFLENDDIARGLQDQHRGNQILPGWSSVRYTEDNSRTIFLMDDALILISIVNSYNYLKNIETSFNVPVEWLTRAEIEFDMVFKNEWKDMGNNKGYFQDSYFTKTDLNMPMNQYAIIGELCLTLYKATGNNMYKEYAVKTANFLKEELIKKTNSYVWYYKRPSPTYPTKEYDDFSHSQLVWRFIDIMYLSGEVFDYESVELIIGTFKYEVIDNDKVFRFFGGMINENETAPLNLLYQENPWLEYYYSLAKYDNEIKDILKKFRSSRLLNYNPNSDFNHIGQFVILDFALEKKYLKQY